MFNVKKKKAKKEQAKTFFDIDLLLSANPQIKEEIDNGKYTNMEEYCESVDIFAALTMGSMQFHEAYEPFNEKMYLKAFPDVEQGITNGSFKSAFDHFKYFGYKEILNSQRIWQRISLNDENQDDEGKNDESSMNESTNDHNESFVEDDVKIATYFLDDPLLYEHVVKYSMLDDPFYGTIFMQVINDTKYLDANPDVRKAIESGTVKNAWEHLLHRGMRDIVSGNREAHPDASLDRDISGHIDVAFITSNKSIYIEGWCFAKNSMIKEIYLSNGDDGLRLTDAFLYTDRKDLQNVAGEKYQNAGFYGYINNDIIDISSSNSFALILVTEDGLARRVPFVAKENTDRNLVSQLMLSHLQINQDMQKDLDAHIGVALNAYLDRYKLVIPKKNIDVEIFGEQVEEPLVSLIVPLYGRIDFVEYQLSQFANDAFFKKYAELIYVLDDPRLENDLNKLCHNIYPVFEVPFRVINAHQNCGYAMANNIGARYANAPLVLFFNSDLFPRDKVWLPQLLKEYDTNKNIGAMCPKLIFEDGAIQHAGMIFKRNDELDMWLNEHPGKGLPDMDPEVKTKPMPAVTGACMLMNKILYEEVGGMSENYFLGDFEDSDLCLKLSEKGYVNYYVPSVMLCHLERQSQSLFSDTSWKGKVTLYNAWQHERKWTEKINAVMKEYYEK